MALKAQYRAIYINYLDCGYETRYCGVWRETEQEAIDDIAIENALQDPTQAWSDIKGNYCARQFTHVRVQTLYTIVADPEPAPTEPAPTEPTPTEPAPTEPAPTEPAPTEPAPTEPAPTEPAPTEPTPDPGTTP